MTYEKFPLWKEGHLRLVSWLTLNKYENDLKFSCVQQVKDVVDFIQNLPGCKEYAEDFALQEIDGQALMLLKADHLMSAMSMKLGPALKICAKIESMRGDRKDS